MNVKLLQSLFLAGSVIAVLSTRANCEEAQVSAQSLRDVQPSETAQLMRSPIVEISNVRVEQTDQGLEVILETTQGEQLQVTPVSEGNVLTDEGLILGVTPGTTTSSAPQPDTTQSEQLPDDEAIELVVTATRTEEELQNVPRTVTIIEREQIEQLAPGCFCAVVAPNDGDWL